MCAAARAAAFASSAVASSSAGDGPGRFAAASVCGQLDADPLAQRRDGLGTHRDPLPRRAEAVERCGRGLPAAGRIGQLGLDALALAAECVEPLLGTRGSRAFERCETLLGRPGALCRGAACRRRRPRSRRRLGGRPLQLARRLVRDLARGRLGLAEVTAQAGEQALRALLPDRDPLGGALQPVEGLDRRLALPGGVGELLLGGVALGEERSQLLLCAPAADPRRGLALLCRCPARVNGGEIELGDPRPQTRDLVRELLGPLRRRRLQRKRAQPLAHLSLDVAGALDLDSDPVQLQLGAMLPPLELAETGGLLDQLASLLRLRGQHRLDLALADDRVHRAAEPDVGEQLDEIGAAHLRAVDEVLALAATVQPPRDRDLGEVQLAEVAALVVEDELDLAAVGGCAALGAVEQDVVGLLGAQLRRRQRAGGPDDRVGDVRLARAVRPHDDGDARLELQLERVRKRLEAAQAERAQMHGREANGRRGRRPLLP